MPEVERRGGFLPLNAYSGLGDGRAVALSGADGSIDWWCVPNMHSPPLFDRLLNPDEGGRFSITPVGPFSVERRYRPESNVHETVFVTATGRARLTESLNSGTAGRLPWAELARRLEGLKGEVEFAVEVVFGDRAGTRSPYLAANANATVFHVGTVLGLLLFSEDVVVDVRTDRRVAGRVTVTAGDRAVLAVVAGRDHGGDRRGADHLPPGADWRGQELRLSLRLDPRRRLHHQGLSPHWGAGGGQGRLQLAGGAGGRARLPRALHP